MPALDNEDFWSFERGDMVKFTWRWWTETYESREFIGRLVAWYSPETAAKHGYVRHTNGFWAVHAKYAKPPDGLETTSAGLREELSQIAPTDGKVPADGLINIVSDHDLTPFVDAELSKFYVEEGRCPRCGSNGYWQALALFCEWHGMFV